MNKLTQLTLLLLSACITAAAGVSSTNVFSSAQKAQNIQLSQGFDSLLAKKEEREDENQQVKALESIANQLRFIDLSDEQNPSIKPWVQYADIALKIISHKKQIQTFETFLNSSFQDDSIELDPVYFSENSRVKELILDKFKQFEILFYNLETSTTSNNSQQLKADLIALAQFMQDKTTAKDFIPLKLTKATKQAPLKLRKAHQSAEQLAQWFATTKAQASTSKNPTPDDLAQTLEIKFTPRIQAQAAALNNNAIEIYDWVKNNTEYLPTYGSLQGSDLTFINQQANAFDTSSLLIAMLRDSGIPARYAYGVIEVPISEMINWLKVDSAENAASLISQGGIPSTLIMQSGQIKAIQIEHVWVEAWIDFIPSRGVKPITGDSWVALDASFKQHTFIPAVDLSQYGTYDMNATITQLDQTATHGQYGSITNVDIEYLRHSINDYINQVIPAVDADHPNITVEEFTNRYTITPKISKQIPASLANKIILKSLTFSAMPTSLMHHLKVKMYDSIQSMTLGAPSIDYSIPLPELQLNTLSVNYQPATAADQQMLDNHLLNNDSYLRPYLINVKPQIQINGVTKIESTSKQMGQMEYWSADISDPNNLNNQASQPYRWASGSQVVLTVNASGISPQALDTHNSEQANLGSGHIRNALHQAGLNYFVGHDLFDQLYAQQVGVRTIRMPSVGAFSSPLNVRYMFGLARTGSMSEFSSDVKRITQALVAPSEQSRQIYLAQSGTTGSSLEGMVWEMLFNKTLGSSAVSTMAILHKANTLGIPVHTITSSNLTDVMPLLQLSADAEQEIFNSVQAGYEVTVPEREFQLGTDYSATGYIIRNPSTDSAIYRLEGGTNGAALIGCVTTALVTRLVFQKILGPIWKKLAKKYAIIYGIGAILGPAGMLLGTIVAFISNIYYMAAFMQASMQFSMLLSTMSLKDLIVEYGIQAAVSAACSLISPCRFGGGKKNGKGPKKCRKGLCWLTNLFGNPVDVVTGAKYQSQTDYSASTNFPLNFTRLYFSHAPFNSPTGIKWRNSYDKVIIFGEDQSNHPWPQNLVLVADDGSYYDFNRGGQNNNEYFTRSDITTKLQALGSDQSAPTAYKVVNEIDEVEMYNAQGRLVSITNLAGITHTLTYNTDDNLKTITDSFGHQIRLHYGTTTKLLTKMIDPDAKEYIYHHDALGNLTQVDYPDGTNLKYHYEDNGLPNALTGITNEKGIRLSHYKYSLSGKVIDEYHIGNVEHYKFEYGEQQTKITDPLGKVRTYHYENINDQDRLVSVDQICSSCGGGGASQQIWDASGALSEQIDFNGNKTTYAFNDRGLETRITLAKDTPQERTIITAWNPNFSEPDTITESSASSGNKVTTYTYYPNGEVETKTITADGQSRTWTYTNNNFGQILTENGPRTDVNDTTTWTYDASGNKRTMTNALGHITKWDNYNAHGQIGTMTDSNNIVTTYTYDALTRLTQSITDGEITQYVYTPTGNLDKLTLPDNSFLQYGYDNADRLDSIEDNLGNKIVYTLDNNGNRKIEETYNDSNALVQTITNVYNDLGQLQNTIGADNQTTTWSYDNNGNEKTQSDPLSHLTQSDYDALNRLTQITDPDLNTIKYAYDKQDNLTKVTDPRNLDTVYTYNGFNEQTKLTSPDTGITTFSYDTASNLTNKTDARGQQAVYTYDALNRVKTITYSDETITFAYDTGINAKGRLNQVTDNSGQTTYTYDTHGRVDGKTQSTNGTNLVNDYDYNAQGQLAKLTTPSGVQITNSYRADGRVTSISVNGIEITRSIEYFAFGEPSTWNYGNNFTYQRTFDSDGRVKTYTQGNDSQTLAYDPASRITSLTDTSTAWGFTYDNLDRLATADKTATSLIWDYDPTGNRLFEKLNGVQTDYTTEPTSNKLSQLGIITRVYDDVGNLQDNGTLTSTYSGRNRLTQVQGTTAPVVYQYNAFGERVSKNSGTQTLFAYDEDGHLLGEYASNGDLIQETIWLGDTPIATIRPNSESHNGLIAGSVKVFFIQPDHLDTPRTIVDNSNQPIWQWHSDPFGKALANQDMDGDSVDFVFNLRFPGQYFDVEAGTHYNYFRDYEAETGRYLQSDPIGLDGGINTYGYVDSNILTFLDIDGLAKKGKGRSRTREIILVCTLKILLGDDPIEEPDLNFDNSTTYNSLVIDTKPPDLPELKPLDSKPKKPKKLPHTNRKGNCKSCGNKRNRCYCWKGLK